MAKDESKGVVVGITEARAGELIASAIKRLMTEEKVRGLIVDAIGGVSKQLAEAMNGLVTEERAIELLKGAVTEERERPQLIQDVKVEEQRCPFDTVWLKGLKFTSSSTLKPDAPGARPKHVPTSRPLLEEDVLSYTVGEEAVTLVASDGQKHVVEF